jgi:hypothetical protein
MAEKAYYHEPCYLNLKETERSLSEGFLDEKNFLAINREKKKREKISCLGIFSSKKISLCEIMIIYDTGIKENRKRGASTVRCGWYLLLLSMIR